MDYYFHCPSCKSKRSFSTVIEQRSGLWLFLLLIGLWIAAFLLAGARRGLVQCDDCRFIFRQPPLPNSPLTKFTHWIIFVIFMVVFTIIFAEIGAFDSSSVPEIKGLSYVESIISNHLRLFILATAIAWVTILISCILTSYFSNRVFRQNHSLRIYVESYEPPPNQSKDQGTQPSELTKSSQQT